MHRHDLPNPQQFARESRAGRSHSETVADRQESDLGRVQLPDETHVAKNRRIASEINRQAVLEAKHVTDWLAEIHWLCRLDPTAAMLRTNHCDVNTLKIQCPPFVHWVQFLKPLSFEPPAYFLSRDDRRCGVSGNLHRITDVINVPVRDQDKIGLANSLPSSRTRRVPFKPWID
jgi:hypothetical protein